MGGQNAPAFILFHWPVVGLCRCEAQRSRMTIWSKMYRFSDSERSVARADGFSAIDLARYAGRSRQTAPFHCIESSTAIIGNMVAINQALSPLKGSDASQLACSCTIWTRLRLR